MRKKIVKRKTLGQALLRGTIKFAGHVEVKGGYYHAMWEEKMDGRLTEGTWLRMEREPENKFDPNAIAVYLSKHGTTKLGYIDKAKAEFYAPFMDLGVKMALRVFEHSREGQPLRINARLYITLK